MPIVNYKQKALSSEKRFFNSSISQKNKEVIKKFMDIYHVSDGRLSIYFDHMLRFLEQTQDIKEDMQNRDKINKIFKGLRNKYKPSVYDTIVNVSVRTVTWLNNGIRPDGFKDIKKISKNHSKRNLSSDDMVTWEEAEQLIQGTPSLQMKAIIATQLDGGFRPSEFIDLTYGNVKHNKDFLVIEVKGGKTGGRNVILWRAVPHLLRWLNAHPTKRANDPLWMQEEQNKGENIKYKYPAIRKRMRELFARINLDKPSDFYNLRHSACVLSKKDNVPEELGAEKFGHSVDFYVNTYGRLSTKDKLERYRNHYGLTDSEEELKKNVVCRCGNIESPGTEICSNCGNPTSMKKALELKSETESRLAEIERKMAIIERFEKLEEKGVFKQEFH